MSLVTNLIVIFDVGENQDEILIQISKFQYQGKSFNIKSVDSKHLPIGWYGGDKMLETGVLIGAYNYFPEKDFIKFLEKNVKWEFKESVLVLIMNDHDERFRFYTLSENSDYNNVLIGENI